MKTFFLSQMLPQNQMDAERRLFSEANAAGEIYLLLYSWRGDVISTGRLQKNLNIDREKCEKDGVLLVERMTGGRAVFHSGDICYSLSIPAAFVKNTGENLNEAIISISQPIIKTFADFGINAQINLRQKAEANANFAHSDFCAQTQTHGELRIDGKKIAASSQIYTNNGILQHGTIPVNGEYLRVCDYFMYADARAREKTRVLLRRNSTCLNEICADLNAEDFMAALAENFANIEPQGVCSCRGRCET